MQIKPFLAGERELVLAVELLIQNLMVTGCVVTEQ
jgi:hypothetical protein